MNEPTDAELLEAVGPAFDDGSDEQHDDRYIVRLSPPIHDVEELVLREPTVYQTLESTRVIGARPEQRTMESCHFELVSKVSGCSSGLIRKMPVRELAEAIDWVTRFEREARPDPFKPIEEIDLDLSPEFMMRFDPPLRGGGKEFNLMRLREPNGGEFERYKIGLEKGTAEALLRSEIRLVGDVSEWHQAAILRMPIRKFVRAAVYLTGFFIASQLTGKRSSLT